MKKMNYFTGFIAMAMLMFISNSCTESIPTYEKPIFTGCTTPGDLKVIVSDGLGTDFGGADVFLYTSDALRTADPQRQNAFKTGTTSNTYPSTVGAMFYGLVYQSQGYFIFARRDIGGGNYAQGSGQSLVSNCNVTSLVVTVAQ